MPDPAALQTMLVRAAIGAGAAAAIALVARRMGSLSASGAAATVAIGVAASAAGWRWGTLLVLYFLAAVLLSRIGSAEKARITAAVVEKGGARDATQVIANGGIFATSVLLGAFGPDSVRAVMHFAALGALASSLSDTWATEVGTLYGGTPRSILTLRPLAAGTSGAISTIGSVAMVAGALVFSLLAGVLGLSTGVVIVTVAGIGGALVDSLLGATLQERRWCAECGTASERGVHDCGTPTVIASGREWMDNDVVNLLGTLAGAAVAVLLATL